MAATKDWSFPEEVRPRPDAVRFDLSAALRSVALLRTSVPEDAFTAEILGTQRIGNGIAIRADGKLLILTIGYLITEAQTIWLTTNDGQTVPGHALAYDQASGFGLVLPLGHLNMPTLERGSIAATKPGSKVFVIGNGGEAHSLSATVVARREFAGYWEYLLDDALFTAPPHPQWNGAALLDEDGLLIGVGSLLVQESVSGEIFDANMFVPIDLLEPILGDLVGSGGSSRNARPWLGMYTTEVNDRVVIASLTEDGPAYKAGLRSGDVVMEVAGRPIAKLSELFRTIWNTGPTGTIIAMTVARGKKTSRVRIESGNREDYLKKPVVH